MGRRLDAVGQALLAACVAWTLVTGSAVDARPSPVGLGFLAAGAAFVAGRLLAANWDARVPAAVVVVIGFAGLVDGRRALLGGAGDPPLRYGNANGTLYALAALAALMVAVAARRREQRALALGLMAFFVLVTFTTRSAGASACLAIVLGVLALGRLTRAAHLVPLAGAILVVGAVGTTVVVSDSAERIHASLAQATSFEVRSLLWREARTLMAENRVRGVGPGGFELASRVTRDPDLRWAHSDYLQQGAEQGAVGLALLLGLIGWTLARCWATRDGTLVPAVGAGALTLLALHATVDYVLHFPGLVVTAAFMAGAATAGPALTPESPDSPHPRR